MSDAGIQGPIGTPSGSSRVKRFIRRLARVAFVAVLVFYGVVVLSLVYLRSWPPPTTGVQVQRRVEALFAREAYVKRYVFRPTSEISPHLLRAVVAAEDSRFWEHRGFDWEELRAARETASRLGTPMRGASTITQQLVKNLFLTTHRSYVRKGLEYTITPLAELILGKERILELYVNVIEWGPGIYGAEAAARHHYGIAASGVSREYAARLAAVIPAPLARTPDRMTSYAATILGRMSRRGW